MKKRWPVLFSPVMASGIVSLAAREAGLVTLSDAMLWLTALLYLALLAHHGVRIARRPAVIVGELRTSVIFDYLTFVAGGAVLGSVLLVEGSPEWVGWALLLLSGLVWLGLSATVTVELLVTRTFRPRSELQGGWLLAVVAPQSLAALALALAGGSHASALTMTAFALWAMGSVLYVPIALVRVRRMELGGQVARALRADDWILMGALAISALAGSRLADRLAGGGSLAGARTAVVAVVVAQLILACALLVLLVYGELAHARAPSHAPIRNAERWTTVFPLGMLSVAAHALADTLPLGALDVLGDVLLVPALAAWLLTALAGVASLSRGRFAPHRIPH